jgi:hypothetical protein
MSDEYERLANHNDEKYYENKSYQIGYQRGWQSRTKKFIINPTDAQKFKSYYDEYTTHSQQNFLPIVDFKDFVLQFAEMGFLNWRHKTKQK